MGYLSLVASIAWEICVLLVQSREIFARCPELLRLGQTNRELFSAVLGEELSLASTPLQRALPTLSGGNMSCAEPNDDAYARCRSRLLIVLMGDQFYAGALMLQVGGEWRARCGSLQLRRRRLILRDGGGAQ